MAITLEQARAAKESGKALLAALPGVVGVGITKIGGDYALRQPPPSYRGRVVPEAYR
jgi:hypothetical protein